MQKKRTRDDDSDSSMQNFFKKRISGTQKTDSEISEIEEELSYREYVRRKEKKNRQNIKFTAAGCLQKILENSLEIPYEHLNTNRFPKNLSLKTS